MLGVDIILGASMYQQALHKLVAGAYLKPSTVLSHISPRDKQIKYEAEERSKLSGIPTTKELREAKELAATRLKREEEAETVGLVRSTYHASYSGINICSLEEKSPGSTWTSPLQSTAFFSV